MKIAVNGVLLSAFNTGVENYISCLLNEFDRLHFSKCHEIIAYVKKSIVMNNDYQWRRIKVMPVHHIHVFRGARILWEHFLFPAAVKKSNFDLIHAPGYIIPLTARVPLVVTIHDVNAWQHPEWCKLSNAIYYRIFLKYSILNATKIIVPSSYIKNKILNITNISPQKITVIHEGVRSIFQPGVDQQQQAEMRKQYALPDKYVLYVGTIEPKKNVKLILDVYEHLCEQFNDIGLVIVGKIGWKCKSILKTLRRLMLKKKVVMTGYIPVPDLAVIYRMAEIFLFPSLVEGFGVPPLEAMACGTPVIASNRGAIPEIVGSAAIKIDPTSHQQFFDAIRTTLISKSLRQELIEKGWQRAGLFSWETAAEKTWQVYESIS